MIIFRGSEGHFVHRMRTCRGRDLAAAAGSESPVFAGFLPSVATKLALERGAHTLHFWPVVDQKIINLGRLVMEDDLCRRFFLDPQETFHRRYEALRAFFVEGRSLEETAARFGYREAGLRSMISRFRCACRAGQGPPFFFRTGVDARPVGAVAKTRKDPNRRRLPTAAN